ncbi:TPA: ferric iron uptake transcriptional regulator [Pseudomonas aeruginosa]|nr:ferric iron uptake transcriptional regulator [Pseudomonas aeruginosa]HCF1774332.1 ferric iron uptake transcriptional regulator [Pseudomonas aeruginosa]HCF6827502.1 ferric iron uptake transcriptional regulator [Pseudomonas aeruginosa]HCR1180536.1 ferric iron uptake transcriptional regulator [Pseudomonas aeruginosa]
MPDSEELRSRGLKVTLPRLQILEIFQKSEVRHLSAEDVYRLLLAQGHEVGLATVYRVLSQLHQAGLLKQAHFESEKAVYELNDGQHHDHLVCITCGRVQEFHADEIERRQRAIAREHGFEVVEHTHVLYGRCTNTECGHRRRMA